MSEYRFVGVGHSDELSDGRLVAYGDSVDLTSKDVEANKRLIDDGLLLAVDSPDKPKRRRQES